MPEIKLKLWINKKNTPKDTDSLDSSKDLKPIKNEAEKIEEKNKKPLLTLSLKSNLSVPPENNSTQTNEPSKKTEENTEKIIPKINISGIKISQKKSQWEIWNSQSKTDETNKNVKTIELDSNNNKEDNSSIKSSKSKDKKEFDTKIEDLKDLQEPSIKVEEQDVNKNIPEVEIKPEESIIKWPWEIFKNYDSDFRKNERTILNQVKAMRFLPKTRKWLVFSLIWLTAFTIISLWIIDPNNHSLNSYKANILYIMSKNKDQSNDLVPNINLEQIKNNEIINSNSGSNNTNSWSIDEITDSSWTTIWTWETSSWTTEKNLTESWSEIQENTEELEMLKEKWVTIKADIIILPNWDKVYSYKWNTYNKDWLQEILKKEVDEEISKKTKEYLSELYLNKTN